jgi:hypothetical protein
MMSAKLNLKTEPEQFQALRAVSLAYRDGLNAVSRYAYAHGKTSSNQCLHQGMYAQLRTRYHLPSQLACSVERQVAATYKGLWTKVKKNAAARLAGLTRKRYKGLDQAPKFVSPTVHYTYERDYTFKTQQQVSLNTLEGRITLAYQGYAKHVALIQQGARIGDAKLWYDQRKQRFYLLVSLEVEVADPTFESHKDVVERCKRRKRRRKTNGKGTEPVSPKARKANRVYSQWSFAELHADLVGARNLTLRTLLLRQDWGKTGHLSVAPDASDREAKAARLSRYAELRWSPEASPSPCRGRGN